MFLTHGGGGVHWRGRRCRAAGVARRVLTTLLLTLLPPAVAEACTEAPGFRDAAVRVGYSHFPPFSASAANGGAEGYSIDLVRLLAESAGCDVEFLKAESLSELLDMLSKGEVDMTPLLAVTNERRLLGRFTRPVGAFRNDVFSIGESRDGPADLVGARIGAVKASGAARSAAGVEGAEVAHFGSNEEMLVALMSGRIDAVVAAPEAFLMVARAVGVDAVLKTMPTPLSSRPRAFLVANERGDLVEAFDRVIASDPSFFARSAAIHERWFGAPHGVLRDLGVALSAIAVAVAIFAAALLLLLRARRRTRWLTQALDATGGVVGLFDEDGRPVFWNAALEHYVPAQLSDLWRGCQFRDLLIESRLEGPFAPKMTRREAEAYADDVIARLNRGEDTTRLLYTEDGRRIEARELKLDSGFAVIRQDVTDMLVAAEDLSDTLRRFKHRNASIAEGLCRRRRMLNQVLTSCEAAMDSASASETVAWAIPVLEAELKKLRLAERRLLEEPIADPRGAGDPVVVPGAASRAA